MANRYWVGGTASWDGTAGTKWALTSGGAGGQAVPTSADDVFFDAASGAVTCTIATGNTGAKSINCTGFTGTLTGTADMSVAGSLTFVAGMTYTYTGEFTITATATLITGGKTFANLTINASGGTVTLGSALTMGIVTTLNLVAGTLTTSASNFSITADELVINTAGAKTLTLNASTVLLTGGGSAFDYTGSNLTFNAGTSTITLDSGGADLNAGAGLTFNNVTFTSSSILPREILGANTFNTLTLNAASAEGSAAFEFDANQTITTLVAAGTSVLRRILLKSTVRGTARTLTVATYTTKQNIDFQDITAAGASAPWSGTSIGNCLGNSNITFTAAKTVYWNLAGAQNWSSTGWATTSGGTPAVGNFPIAQDTAIFDNAGAATSVAIDSYSNVASINASARTNALTLSGGSSSEYYGNFINGTGVTISTSTLQFSGRSTQTLTSAGATFPAITCLGPGNTLSLNDALTSTGRLTITSSSFNANTFAVTVSELTASTATSINLGSASWTVTGSGAACWSTTVTGSVSGTAGITLSNNTTTARTFAAGTNTFGKLTIGGNTSISTTTIQGTSTYSEIASTKTVAHTIVFPNVVTTVGAFTVQGSVGNVVTLSRTGVGGTFTLTKTGGGVVSSDYLSISNSTATPIDTWYAGANSTNGGGNTNWIFSSAPPPSSGKFFMFF
jgi:hypothetical protein